MQIINAFLISTLAGISTVIGSFIVFLNIKNSNKYISFCLAFTATIMIGLSIFELFPDAFIILLHKYSFFVIFIIVLSLFVVGKTIISIISKLIINNDNLYKIGLLNMIVLILHNFPEGITTFIASYNDISIGIKIGLAIMLHNIPEGIAIASPLYISTNNKKKAIYKTFISGISEPLGALFAYIFIKDHINEYLMSFLLLIVSVIMIVISIEKLLPESLNYKNNSSILLGFILGILIVGVSLFIF